MKRPTKCPHCHLTYDLAVYSLCPFCGQVKDCPDPLCLRDMPGGEGCDPCPKKPTPKVHNPGWGGRRAGAGAPRANLNRLVHGRNSKLLEIAVEKLAEDPELRAFLLLLARAATTGEIPQTTKQLITRALGGRPLQREAASIRLKKMREGVSDA